MRKPPGHAAPGQPNREQQARGAPAAPRLLGGTKRPPGWAGRLDERLVTARTQASAPRTSNHDHAGSPVTRSLCSVRPDVGSGLLAALDRDLSQLLEAAVLQRARSFHRGSHHLRYFVRREVEHVPKQQYLQLLLR
jgi:hypothetical protein